MSRPYPKTRPRTRTELFKQLHQYFPDLEVYHTGGGFTGLALRLGRKGAHALVTNECYAPTARNTMLLDVLQVGVYGPDGAWLEIGMADCQARDIVSVLGLIEATWKLAKGAK